MLLNQNRNNKFRTPTLENCIHDEHVIVCMWHSCTTPVSILHNGYVAVMLYNKMPQWNLMLVPLDYKWASIKSGAHWVWRAREHVTMHTHNVNGIIQTWRTFLKIVYSLYSKNYDVGFRNMQLSVQKTWSAWINWWKENYSEQKAWLT